MHSILDIHDYDEGFLERFTSQTIPIYDLWSIRPLQNEQKELISGGSNDADKFRDFITDHSNQEFPHPLVIVIGNAEKTNTDRMSNTSKKYFKLKFEKFKGNDLGTPLTLSGTPEPYPTNQTPPMAFNGMNFNKANSNNSMQGFSLGDIHGIIDRNVADATRSIKAEYQEQAALREADSIKRMAELETKMEMYKLDIRAKEVSNKEDNLNRELEDFERKKLEGLGTVKDYTKTIAGGLFELGKSAFGLDDKDSETTKKEVKTETKPNNLGTTNLDNDEFTEVKNDSHSENNIKSENNLDIVLQGIANLDEEQKMALLDALIPEEKNSPQITQIDADEKPSVQEKGYSVQESEVSTENSDTETIKNSK